MIYSYLFFFYIKLSGLLYEFFTCSRYSTNRRFISTNLDGGSAKIFFLLNSNIDSIFAKYKTKNKLSKRDSRKLVTYAKIINKLDEKMMEILDE